MSYDPIRTASFFDDYGEREWTRFDDGRTPRVSLDVHLHYLRRFVREGDRVLDAGAGPGRFTLELARLGADVVAADLSPGQLELNRARLVEAGLEHAVREWTVADVTDLRSFATGSFDVAVCYGGPLSYVLGRAPDAFAELVRVTRPGGHVLLSVMSLVGATVHRLEGVLALAREQGASTVEEVVRSGVLPASPNGHVAMRLFRWRELEELLAPHGTVVAATAAGLLGSVDPAQPALRELVTRLELELAAEPGAVECGAHMLAVLRTRG